MKIIKFAEFPVNNSIFFLVSEFIISGEPDVSNPDSIKVVSENRISVL